MHEQLIRDNRSQTERLAALIARLTEADYARPLADGGTVTALLGHLAFWDRRVAVLLERWAREGISLSPMDGDAVNAVIQPLFSALSPREAARLALEAAELADSHIEAAPPDLLDAILAVDAGINLARSTHRIEHIEQIERALTER